MQRPALRTDTDDQPPHADALPAGAPRPRELRGEDREAHASPARDLQERLRADVETLAHDEPIPGRWSARRSLAFTVGTSLLLWGGIGWLAARMLS